MRADGSPFVWRGITGFRLLEMEAAGRQADVDAYLAWAASNHLTIVRVLAMAKHLFELPPDRGAAQLDALLRRAARHGLYVEIVALADTASYSIDPAVQVARIGTICARHANALLEIANEPYHATQAEAVRNPEYLASLLKHVPPGVLKAEGAQELPLMAAGGDYVTAHFPRSSRAGGWGHVQDLAQGRALVRQARKPVINDEPIGAGQRYEPGRRDDDPERFRAAALASRMIGLGATFHYEGGLQGELPRGRELDCFHAWQEAWSLLPGDDPLDSVDPGSAGSPARAMRGPAPAAVYIATRKDRAWALLGGTSGDAAAIDWADGWVVREHHEWPHSRWYAATRNPH